MKKILCLAAAYLCLAACSGSPDKTAHAIIYQTTEEGDGEGRTIGRATFTDMDGGVKVFVWVKDLTPGEHGMHAHQYPSCAPVRKNGLIEKAGQAGGHFDPTYSGKHAGPGGSGHKGDFPPLYADKHGNAERDFFVQGLKAADFKNRSLIIHAGGDNFSDSPLPLGGGGARVACGIIR